MTMNFTITSTPAWNWLAKSEWLLRSTTSYDQVVCTVLQPLSQLVKVIKQENEWFIRLAPSYDQVVCNDCVNSQASVSTNTCDQRRHGDICPRHDRVIQNQNKLEIGYWLGARFLHWAQILNSAFACKIDQDSCEAIQPIKKPHSTSGVNNKETSSKRIWNCQTKQEDGITVTETTSAVTGFLNRLDIQHWTSYDWRSVQEDILSPRLNFSKNLIWQKMI